MVSQTPPKKVWASLLTNADYLPGLLTLNSSLKNVNSKYPLVALVIDTLPEATLKSLTARSIPTVTVPRLVPAREREYSGDPRFFDTWTKLAAFSLSQFERVVLLDSDMLVLKNMDELMDDLPLDPPGKPDRRVLAAGCACVCNPLKRPHYPKEWIPENCSFTAQHGNADAAQKEAPDPGSLQRLNSGLLVIIPSKVVYEQILERMNHDDTADMKFPDQDLLAELYKGQWVSLPYIYNALKTLRWKGVHDAIWRDDEVKNIHYILGPKPWNEIDEKGVWQGNEESHKWWVEANRKRIEEEKESGITDGN